MKWRGCLLRKRTSVWPERLSIKAPPRICVLILDRVLNVGDYLEGVAVTILRRSHRLKIVHMSIANWIRGSRSAGEFMPVSFIGVSVELYFVNMGLPHLRCV